MNAPAQIRAAAPFDLNAAHMEAHKWVEIARPLIKAYLALDMVQSDVIVAAHEADPNYAHDMRTASHRLANTMRDILCDIEGIRDQWIADLSPPSPNWGRSMHKCSPEAIAYDDLCDMWAERCRDVASVDSAIDREARS